MLINSYLILRELFVLKEMKNFIIILYFYDLYKIFRFARVSFKINFLFEKFLHNQKYDLQLT
jgi:hypothetical protein